MVLGVRLSDSRFTCAVDYSHGVISVQEEQREDFDVSVNSTIGAARAAWSVKPNPLNECR